MFRICIAVSLLMGIQNALAADGTIEPKVEVEEVVTRYLPADNGAGPLWCYGSTVIGRVGEEVYLSVIETGKDVPLLCNTRWQLWQRPDKGPWKLVRQEEDYRQREPCPIGLDPAGKVFLSVNPSTQPPGTKYGPCRPLVLEFDAKDPAGAFATQEPAWAPGTKFTDHSYRGFSADGKNGELLLMNIHSESGDQFVSYRNRQGQWQAKGSIHFPIRSCYPQVLLKDKAAFVLAIGDIVEPNEEWKKLKFEKTKNSWDYVFRRLFFTWTPDIEKTGFCELIEIDTVEKTAGHITNLDLAVDASGAVQVLYLRQPHQYDFLRDKFFPGETMTVTLEVLTIREGKVVGKRTMAQRTDKGEGLRPSYGRFHTDAEGKLWIVAAGWMQKDGKDTFGNFLLACDGQEGATVRPILLEHPFHNFFTATTRGGSRPSDTVDLFGIADDDPNLRYVRVKLSR
jgi:hypothetical protein